MEKQAAAVSHHLQVLSLFVDRSAALLVHLGQFRIIQVDPGIAVRLGLYAITIVQRQGFLQGHFLLGIILHTHGSLGLHQAHCHSADAVLLCPFPGLLLVC